MFNVILKSFDAGAKPKIIKEVKSLVPNLTLIEVCPDVVGRAQLIFKRLSLGQEIRRSRSQNAQRESVQRRS